MHMARHSHFRVKNRAMRMDLRNYLWILLKCTRFPFVLTCSAVPALSYMTMNTCCNAAVFSKLLTSLTSLWVPIIDTNIYVSAVTPGYPPSGSGMARLHCVCLLLHGYSWAPLSLNWAELVPTFPKRHRVRTVGWYVSDFRWTFKLLQVKSALFVPPKNNIRAEYF